MLRLLAILCLLVAINVQSENISVEVSQLGNAIENDGGAGILSTKQLGKLDGPIMKPLSVKKEATTSKSREDELLSSVDRLLTYISWLSGVVLAIVALFLAGGTIYVVRANSNVGEKITIANQIIDNLIQKAEREVKQKLESLEKKAAKDLQLLTHAAYLRLLIKEEDKDVNDIYSHLRELVYAKNEEFDPLIKKILDMNIDDEISVLARKGLERR